MEEKKKTGRLKPKTEQSQSLGMGTNAKMEHQRILGKLFYALTTLYQTGHIPYEPFTEMSLKREKGGKTPDILLWDGSAQTKYVYPVLVEICTTSAFETDIAKLKGIMGDAQYGVQEGFVYDYELRKWAIIRKQDKDMHTVMSTAASAVLNVRLHNLV
jgi:Uma2 family endonuclease